LKEEKGGSLKLSRYIEISLKYRQYRRSQYRIDIGILDIGFFDISMTNKISAIFDIVVQFCRLFDEEETIARFTENYIWQRDTSLCL